MRYADRPFASLVLTHADQAIRRDTRSLGDPSEHRSTFVATERELLAGDQDSPVWQQCGGGLGEDLPVRIDAGTSLANILAWMERVPDKSRSSRRDNPKPDPESLYPSSVEAAIPKPANQLTSALSVQLTRAEKDALDLLAAWPLCTREQLARLMGGVTLRRATRCCVPSVNTAWRGRQHTARAHRRGADLPGPPGPGCCGVDAGQMES